MTATPSRDFTVAVFIVHDRKVLLHLHAKLGIWLPPGGHIEPDELPDEAAVREVLEESGLTIELVGETGIDLTIPEVPRQLIRPEGIQLERIGIDHEHIDLIYFARVVGGVDHMTRGMQWVSESDFGSLGVNDEVSTWARKAITILS